MLNFQQQKKSSTEDDDLLANLPPSSLRFCLISVRQCHEKIFQFTNSKFKSTFVSEENVLKPFRDMNENEAAVLNNLSEKSLNQ